jgi:hypothetical protein
MKYNLLVNRDGVWRRIASAQADTAKECKRQLERERNRWSRHVDDYFSAAFKIEKENGKWAK